MNSLFHKDKGELKEERIIGTVSGYNPRVKEIQEILKDSGFNPGSIDGLMGARTRKVIREFQKAKGLKPTGRIDSITLLALNREKETFLNHKKDKIEKTLPTLIKESPRDIKSKEETLRIMGPREKEIKETLPKDRTRQIQLALRKAGFYKGKIDGKIGPQTRNAIRVFQKTIGLKQDGIVGQETWEELCKYLKD
jgi:peptidoglycan hydrolase-like protein with peptidoglycan-binding domain